MSESFVGFGHLVGLIAFAYGGSRTIRSIHQLSGKALGKCSAGPLSAVGDDPGGGKSNTTLLLYLDRYLVGRTADTSGFYFNKGSYIFDGFIEDINGLLLAAVFHQAQSIIEQSLSGALLATLHHAVHKPLNQLA